MKSPETNSPVPILLSSPRVLETFWTRPRGYGIVPSSVTACSYWKCSTSIRSLPARSFCEYRIDLPSGERLR